MIFLRPTAYAFTIMLAAVLAGIALGSAIATPLLRRRLPWLAVLTVTQIAIGVTAVLSFNALVEFQAGTERLTPAITALGLDPYLAPILVASMMAMLPTTVLLGFAFPLGLSLWTAGTPNPARRIGVFYSLNVFGAIAGSVLGGFVLLPLLGSRGSLIAASSLAALSGLVLALRQWRLRPNFAAIVGPVAFAMSALNAADPFAIAAAPLHRTETVLWRIGALPTMLHPNPRTALVVGLGGGATPVAGARFPGVDVDVVELSAAVVEGSRYFNAINFGLLERPNVSVFPHTTLWGDGSLMLGSLEPFALSASGYEQRRQQPQFKELFDWDLEAIRKNYVAGPADLAAWLGPGPS